ncbi:hypothetical protein X737_11985 [Mesorhizobium sp. L48C026A00]|nr:hypothetical protein X737_11985 [Mesorhizobium sp. L48C026A00]
MISTSARMRSASFPGVFLDLLPLRERVDNLSSAVRLPTTVVLELPFIWGIVMLAKHKPLGT